MASTVDQGRDTSISAVHFDILQTHILTRLDGPTLASTGCASSTLHALSTEQKLWTDICNQTWPSTNDPLVHRLISTFPAGHRSFFSDSFPTLDHRRSSQPNTEHPVPTSQLISAVDIHYQDKLIFSKLQESETLSGWFMCSPFRFDLLDPKESVPTPVKLEGGEDTCRSNMEKNLTISWVVIDPTRKRAANVSSLRPVSVQRHWLTGDIEARYATIMAADRSCTSSEFVQCAIVVTCGGKEGGELHVKEVSLTVEDMDGKTLSGKECLVILQEAMGNGRRKKGKGWEGKERYEKYLELKRERRERKQRREKTLDMVCIATGVTIFLAFWALILFR
ncbi:F-box protein At2g27310-like [Cornus florida]|uniref:F-box protein At2g27310-like n=1 Tax=Cornus florida TaxID=4283 RepID=UPI0028A1697D|nr:F-box protein At2g27310-like [Cornus florida]